MCFKIASRANIVSGPYPNKSTANCANVIANFCAGTPALCKMSSIGAHARLGAENVSRRPHAFHALGGNLGGNLGWRAFRRER